MGGSSRTRQYKDIDEYIAVFPSDVQEKLKGLREAILESAPEAEETISYGMPAFKLGGILVYFAAYERHIGFYPTSSAIIAFKERLSSYKQSKGAVRFPIDEPLPLELVREMVSYRVKENQARSQDKKRK